MAADDPTTREPETPRTEPERQGAVPDRPVEIEVAPPGGEPPAAGCARPAAGAPGGAQFSARLLKTQTKLEAKAKKCGVPKTDSLDLAQDTIVAVLATRPDLFIDELTPEEERAWWGLSFTTLRNKISDYFRRQGRSNQSMAKYAEGKPHSVDLYPEKDELLKKIFDLPGLNETQKLVLRLRHVHENTNAKIAEIMRLPKTTVQTTITNAYKELKQILGKDVQDE